MTLKTKENTRQHYKPHLTGRGWRLVIATLTTTIIGALMRDTLLLTLAGIAAALIIYQTYTLQKTWMRAGETNLNPKQADAKIVAGETTTHKFILTSKTEMQLQKISEGYRINTVSVKPGENSLEVTYKSTHFGEFKLKSITATIHDQLGLVESHVKIPITISTQVYPKTTIAVAEATRFLYGEDIYTLGEEPTRIHGSGFEYAETRDYIRGDSRKNIDWKATARLRKIMVKDHYVEGGTGVHVIFDSKSPDPISHDELTNALIQISLSYARRGTKITLTKVEAEEATDYTDLQPYEAVSMALKIAFEDNRSAVEPAYELLDPQSSAKTRKILATQTQNGVNHNLSQYQRFTLSDEETRKRAIYISSLQGDPVEILNLANEIRAKSWELEVIQPTRPWLHTQTLEEAKKMSDYYAKLYKVLNDEHIQIQTNTESHNVL